VHSIPRNSRSSCATLPKNKSQRRPFPGCMKATPSTTCYNMTWQSCAVFWTSTRNATGNRHGTLGALAPHDFLILILLKNPHHCCLLVIVFRIVWLVGWLVESNRIAPHRMPCVSQACSSAAGLATMASASAGLAVAEPARAYNLPKYPRLQLHIHIHPPECVPPLHVTFLHWAQHCSTTRNRMYTLSLIQVHDITNAHITCG
jgi:hypothetical protein